jgi:hypothetical protein
VAAGIPDRATRGSGIDGLFDVLAACAQLAQMGGIYICSPWGTLSEARNSRPGNPLVGARCAGLGLIGYILHVMLAVALLGETPRSSVAAAYDARSAPDFPAVSAAPSTPLRVQL